MQALYQLVWTQYGLWILIAAMLFLFIRAIFKKEYGMLVVTGIIGGFAFWFASNPESLLNTISRVFSVFGG